MEKSNKKKIGIAVVILLILFLLSFFATKTITDNSKNKKEDTINNVSDKENSTSSDNNSTKSQEKDEKEDKKEETFLIKFAYDNGTILQSTFVKKGELPVYTGPTPYIKGYKFIGWNRKIREASEDTTYFAVFRKIEKEEEEEYPYVPPVSYTITVKVKEEDKEHCSEYGGSGTYASGAIVEIFANPKETYATVWDDDNTSNPRMITVTGDKTYTAHFETGYDLTYYDYKKGENTVRVNSGETINIILNGGSIGATPTTITMDENKNINTNDYIAKLDGYTFKGYIYDNQSSPKTLTASFIKKVEIVATVGSSWSSYGKAFVTGNDKFDGSGQAADNKYDKDSTVYIYAKPTNDKYDFVQWNDGNTDNPRLVSTSDNSKKQTYTAEFATGYKYMYLENIGDYTATVTMDHNDFDGYVCTKKVESESKELDQLVFPDDIDFFDVDGNHSDGHYVCPAPDFYLEYRIDTEVDANGVSYNYGFWEDFNDYSNPNVIAFKTIDVEKNQRICFRAKKINGVYLNTHSCNMIDLPSTDQSDGFIVYDSTDHVFSQIGSQCVSANMFTFKNKEEANKTSLALGGALISLLDGTGNSTSVITGSNDKHDYYFSFGCLFYGETMLTSIEKSEPLPSELSIGSFYSTFRNIGISTIPDTFLPAANLKNSCYAYMFAENANITTISKELMLPSANGLVDRCYWYMFYKCINLQSVVLPATELAADCYFKMFSHCSSLNSVEVGFNEFNLINHSTYYWLEDVSGTGTFKWNGSNTIDNRNAYTIPAGWSVTGQQPAFSLNDTNAKELSIIQNEPVIDDSSKYILKVNIIDDNVWYSVYEYNENTKLYDFVNSDMKTDIVEDHDYGLNYFYSDDEILDINDMVCEDGPSLISVQEA